MDLLRRSSGAGSENQESNLEKLRPCGSRVELGAEMGILNWRSGLIGLALSCGAAHAQQLWGVTEIGMTQEQVLAAVPHAQQRPAASSNRDGSVNALEATGIVIADAPFKAMFTFAQDHLTEVRVSTSPSTKAETERVGNAVLEALRAKYGPEIARDPDGAQYTWASGKTTVKLDILFIHTMGLVNVFYSGKIAKDADKL